MRTAAQGSFVLALLAFSAQPLLAEPVDPLIAVERQRASIVSRIATHWGAAFEQAPGSRRLTQEQLAGALWALRSDRLLAAALAGDAEAVESVLSEGRRAQTPARESIGKALGGTAADSTYTPVSPCRIVDTRAVGGVLAPSVARSFVAFAPSFAAQGGAGTDCAIPGGVAAIAVNVFAIGASATGFIRLWSAGQPEPSTSTINYEPPMSAIATGTIVPVDGANANAFSASAVSPVHLVVDVVGYFRTIGAAGTGLRIVRDPVVDTVNTINGSSANSVDPGVRGATIAGGGVPTGDSDPDSLEESPNRITDSFGVIGGGFGNTAGDAAGSTGSAAFATVAGGQGNIARGYHTSVGGGWGNTASEHRSTVAGGALNTATRSSTIAGGDANNAYGGSAIGGGVANDAKGGSAIGGGAYNVATSMSVIGGGESNRVSGSFGTVGGGLRNAAGGEFSTIPGGWYNETRGYASFAAGSHNVIGGDGQGSIVLGQYAHAQAAGCLVFGDDSTSAPGNAFGSPVTCHAPNQVKLRGTGGFWFFTGGNSDTTYTGAHLAAGSGSWTIWSDRDGKHRVSPVEPGEVLERVAALPIATWSWKTQDESVRHMGPMAQDFHAAFGLGESERGISAVDAQGVTLAAIQGLNAKLEAREAALRSEVQARDAEISTLRTAVTELQRALRLLTTIPTP